MPENNSRTSLDAKHVATDLSSAVHRSVVCSVSKTPPFEFYTYWPADTWAGAWKTYLTQTGLNLSLTLFLRTWTLNFFYSTWPPALEEHIFAFFFWELPLAGYKYRAWPHEREAKHYRKNMCLFNWASVDKQMNWRTLQLCKQLGESHSLSVTGLVTVALRAPAPTCCHVSYVIQTARADGCT